MKTQSGSRSEFARTIALSALAAAITLAFSGNLHAQAVGQARPSIPPGIAGKPLPKIAATSSNLELFEAQLDAGGNISEPQELLRVFVDIPNRGTDLGTDLLVRFDGECAAWVSMVTPVEGVSTSFTTWLELDGVPVAV
jgi:hypothetical protein